MDCGKVKIRMDYNGGWLSSIEYNYSLLIMSFSFFINSDISSGTSRISKLYANHNPIRSISSEIVCFASEEIPVILNPVA